MYCPVIMETATLGKVAGEPRGSGPGLALLHRSLGGDSLDATIVALEKHFTVLAPAMSGFDDAERLDWLRSPRDLATVVSAQLADSLGSPMILVGLGLGGWVAAEIAVASPERVKALVLVSPMGVQPIGAEIVDPFLISTDRYTELSFATEEDCRRVIGDSLELGSPGWVRRERNREMTTRIAWKPRMFDATLPYRLAYTPTPTLILWGDKDKILPREAAERYASCLPNATVKVYPGRGHMLECEDPQGFATDVAEFVAALDQRGR